MARIEIFVNNTKISILAISETWLDSSVTNSEVSLDGFNIIRRDRDIHWGGVCIYIKSDLAFSERTDLQNDSLEVCWIELYFLKQNQY